jgi:hypothetical protein
MESLNYSKVTKQSSQYITVGDVAKQIGWKGIEVNE